MDTHRKINSHFQSVVTSVKTAAKTAPKNPPTGDEAPKHPSATFRHRPGGTIRVIVATQLGIRMPPPTPVSARMAMKAA